MTDEEIDKVMSHPEDCGCDLCEEYRMMMADEEDEQ